MGMDVAIDRDGRLLVIRLRGELTVTTVGALEAPWQEKLTDDIRGVLVDDHGMTFMDSSGLSALIGLQRQGKSHAHAAAFVGFHGRRYRSWR